ncbi:MAG: pseudouridine synthase [candidate division Zixibacteria bacterium]|nr:pseudouridine synthase [candidate division Zixibacteria bacterium]
MMRLNKFLSRCGVASRRQADEMILAGRVIVNGQKVDQLGLVIDEINDVVRVDEETVRLPAEESYVILNKPKGYISSLVDKFNRPTVIDLIRGVKDRVYPVGRLDLDTEGILLLTNDGELAYRLAHPKYEIKKEYVVTIKGLFPEHLTEKMEQGVKLEDGYLAKSKAKLLSANESNSVIQMVLTEGKKREIKRIFAALGYNVKHLKRIRFADISCEGMRTGSWRQLNRKEVLKLKRKVGLQ